MFPEHFSCYLIVYNILDWWVKKTRGRDSFSKLMRRTCANGKETSESCNDCGWRMKWSRSRKFTFLLVEGILQRLKTGVEYSPSRSHLSLGLVGIGFFIVFYNDKRKTYFHIHWLIWCLLLRLPMIRDIEYTRFGVKETGKYWRGTVHNWRDRLVKIRPLDTQL